MRASCLQGALAIANVFATARLMFASRHDLLLASVLLVFAGGISMSFGYLIAGSVADHLAVRLNRAAQAVAEGDLDVMLEPKGRDEVSELSRSFERMTYTLSEAAQVSREQLEIRRRRPLRLGEPRPAHASSPRCA